MAIARHVVQRDEQRGLLVVDVVANAPPHPVERRIGAEPFDGSLAVGQLDGMAVGTARRIRLVEPADRVVAVRDPEHVVGRPAVVEIVRPDAGQAATGQCRDLLERELIPFADDDRVELAIVGARTGGRIEERHRLVQIVQHRGVPIKERLHHRPGEDLRHDDAVAVVVVGRVFAPIDQSRAVVLVGLPVAVDVDHPVAPIHLGHWRYECYDAVANLPDERGVLDSQAVGQFHQHFRGAGLR